MKAKGVVRFLVEDKTTETKEREDSPKNIPGRGVPARMRQRIWGFRLTDFLNSSLESSTSPKTMKAAKAAEWTPSPSIERLMAVFVLLDLAVRWTSKSLVEREARMVPP
jgi:hypothetical protein